jgi:hypothetical protein
VVAYFAAALSCFRLRGRFSASADTLRRKERRCWTLLAGVLSFLCINKQLDLQTAMTEFFRGLARQEGWYQVRFYYQVGFIGAMALALPTGAILLLWLARRLPRPCKVAVLGLITLGVFVLIRAASFHHIDRLLGARLLHLRLNWILELSGIAIVLVGTRQRWRQLRGSPHL